VKVLHVAPSIAQLYGGPTHSLAGYAVASRYANIEVSIAAPRCGAADLNAFATRAVDAELHLFSASGSGALSVSPALVRWVRLSAPAYDVVHVHGLFNPISSLSARAALARGSTVVIRPFGTLSRYTFEHRRTALKRLYFRLIERHNLLDAAALHFTTTTERRNADWHGIDFTGRAHVIPPPSLAGHPPARPHSIGGDSARVLFLGRIVPVKNLECLLDAWQLVQRNMPSALLEIAGEGEPSYVRGLRERAVRLGIDGGVTFRGFVTGEKKDELLSQATLVVLPSLHENFGVAVLEALEAGVPVLVSPEVQLADFVRSENAGRVVESMPEPLADAILEMIGTGGEQLRVSVRARGQEIVARNFSPQAIGELLSTMYRAAASRSDQTSLS
jgi:glycosyltransferase involved in cell wall biosynthesis